MCEIPMAILIACPVVEFGTKINDSSHVGGLPRAKNMPSCLGFGPGFQKYCFLFLPKDSVTAASKGAPLQRPGEFPWTDVLPLVWGLFSLLFDVIYY